MKEKMDSCFLLRQGYGGQVRGNDGREQVSSGTGEQVRR
jgi:hypothetical protein